ncbi:hypothetical protein BKA70DRAFT_336099 [Coprinopsis sp. MPI-PUGE-AT-0042]|nr:hypothetical protein BKA70DRAFT_336099 [Coprinopsis sp. MPI-PUGE-AT-0042]
MIVDRKDPRPPSYESEVIGELRGYLAEDGTKNTQDYKSGFPSVADSSGSSPQPYPTSDYSSSYNAMGSKDGDTRDDPFHPPPSSGYLGYAPEPSRSSVDVERNAYQPYPQQERQLSPQEDYQQAPLVGGAPKAYQNMNYADPPAQSTPKGLMGKLMGGSGYRDSLQQRIENKKRGIGIQQRPYVAWTLTAVMIAVMIYELIYNAQKQGSPISLKPTINPMLGPSGSGLISLGARFPPCMKTVEEVPPEFNLACPTSTAPLGSTDAKVCTVAELCSFGYKAGTEPNQWFRFIIPIFLHAGIIHLLLNMLAQMTLSTQIERDMGSIGFTITYFAAGIFGNVLGGNFSLVGVPSVGASGAIFGTVAVTWVDLLAHWKYQYRPVRKLVFMTIELAIGVAIGFIPYVDNFAHIGGFVMGLLVSTIIYPVISESKRHKILMWVARLVAAPIAILLFVLLVRNFYTSNPYAACQGCRYLSCIPMAANNHCQG